MSDVRRWLEGIGLAQYADAFEANEICFDLLTQVDDQTLKDVGVSAAGHRLRIRSAIAKHSAQRESCLHGNRALRSGTEHKTRRWSPEH